MPYRVDGSKAWKKNIATSGREQDPFKAYASLGFNLLQQARLMPQSVQQPDPYFQTENIEMSTDITIPLLFGRACPSTGYNQQQSEIPTLETSKQIHNQVHMPHRARGCRRALSS